MHRDDYDAFHEVVVLTASRRAAFLRGSLIMAVKKYSAGVKEYRQTYWMPEYTPKDTDILACFKITPQAGVDREEIAAAVAAESSTGNATS
jgi:hypothetical protein